MVYACRNLCGAKDYRPKVDKKIHSSCGPCISAHALPLDSELDFYLKNDLFIKKNDLESPLIFVLFLKGKKNKKETLSVTPQLEKVVYEKLSRGLGVRLLIGKVR